MQKKTIWNIFDRLEGDKVVWIITLMLILISIVCIFSSTSRLLEGNETRLDQVKSQLMVVGAGLLVIVGLYNVKRLSILKTAASFGYLVSLILLILLVSRIEIEGVMKSIEINGARRILEVRGFQVHVFEVVKVSMVMYLAWVQDAIKNKTLRWAKDEKHQKIYFLYIPFLSVVALALTGSASACLFIGGIMFLTILLGGGHIKELMGLAAAAVVLLFVCWVTFEITDHKAFNRIGTAINRVFVDTDYEKMAVEAKTSAEFQTALNKLRQPYGAKIAIKESHGIGKGPGQSTQRYIVPDMPEDYMFSFIVEEYGVIGAIIVLIMYVSLLARGSLIANNCGDDLFATLSIAGLSLLISGQAFLHMFVNVDIGPMTGQTLPLISHGKSAFLCFCVAFGVILSISRIAKSGVLKEEIKEVKKIEEEMYSQQLDSHEI